MKSCGSLTTRRATGSWVGRSSRNDRCIFTTRSLFDLEARERNGQMGQKTTSDGKLELYCSLSSSAKSGLYPEARELREIHQIGASVILTKVPALNYASSGSRNITSYCFLFGHFMPYCCMCLSFRSYCSVSEDGRVFKPFLEQ